MHETHIIETQIRTYWLVAKLYRTTTDMMELLSYVSELNAIAETPANDKLQELSVSLMRDIQAYAFSISQPALENNLPKQKET